jgi:hypothetical protein
VWTFKEIAKWVLRTQSHLNFLKSIDQQKVLYLTYEHFAQNPSSAIKQISNFLETPYDPDILNLNSDKYFLKKEHHLIGGNRVKYSPTDTKIEYQDAWKYNITPFDRFAFKILQGNHINAIVGTNEIDKASR